MNMMYIEDCCEILDSMRVPITASDRKKGEYPYYGANGIQDYVSDYIFDDELVLLAEDGGNFGSKEKPIAYRVSGKCWVNNHAHVLKPKVGLTVDYLCYSLMFYNVEGIINGATRQKLTQSAMRKMKIPVRTMKEQIQIVDKLNRIIRIKEQRKQELSELDTLIKARFVEMFGDPVLNPKGWETKKIIEECECMVPGRDKPKSFTGNIPWITIDDLVVNGITYKSKSELGLTEEEIAEVNRKVIPTGSVIMSCVGNLGICSIAGEDMVINQQLHSFQCGKRLDKVFLMIYLGYRKDFMNKWASSTTVLYMNKSVCNSIPVIIPPLSLQNEFADFVQQIDKLRVVIQKSLDEARYLFDSLMQEYFG